MSNMTKELAVHNLNELKRNSYHGYADAIDFALSDIEKVSELEDHLRQRELQLRDTYNKWQAAEHKLGIAEKNVAILEKEKERLEEKADMFEGWAEEAKEDATLLRGELKKATAERDVWKWALDKVNDAINDGDKVDKDTMVDIFEACQRTLKEQDIGQLKSKSNGQISDPALWTPRFTEPNELDR